MNKNSGSFLIPPWELLLWN